MIGALIISFSPDPGSYLVDFERTGLEVTLITASGHLGVERVDPRLYGLDHFIANMLDRVLFVKDGTMEKDVASCLNLIELGSPSHAGSLFLWSTDSMMKFFGGGNHLRCEYRFFSML